MNHSKHIKYLSVSQKDQLWGCSVNSVGYQAIEAGMPYPPQEHPSRYLFSTERGRVLSEFQLVYLSAGKGTFSSSSLGRSENVKAGDMFILFPGEWHSYWPDPNTGWKEYWIGFQSLHIDRIVADGLLPQTHPVLHAGVHESIISKYEEAIAIAQEGKPEFQQLLAGIVEYILGRARFYDTNRSFENSAFTAPMEKAKSIIAANANEILPEQIASEVNMSYTTFRRVFKEYTGFSPAKYILDVRFRKVKEALTNSPLSVKEIAAEMKFDNYEYFLTTFKRLFGMTPSEHRSLTRGE